MTSQIGTERYLNSRLSNPEYEAAYHRARKKIDAVDSVIRALDEQRERLNLSKADLARRAGLQPEVVRRLFGAGTHNPTLSTISALAAAVDAKLILKSSSSTRARSGGERTRRRTA